MAVQALELQIPQLNEWDSVWPNGEIPFLPTQEAGQSSATEHHPWICETISVYLKGTPAVFNFSSII